MLLLRIIIIIAKKITLFFLFLSLFSFQNKLLADGLIFTVKVPYCSKKDIARFEKRKNIKVPTFVKMIYSSKVDIRDLCFEGDVSNPMIVDHIYPFGTIDRGSCRPSENAFLFGHRKNVSSGLFFIDGDGIWYSDYEGKILFELDES